jgi:hypothetical protein
VPACPMSVHRWLGLPAGAQLCDLMGTQGTRRGSLKTSTTHKSGPLKQLAGVHVDKRPLAVSLQVRRAPSPTTQQGAIARRAQHAA